MNKRLLAMAVLGLLPGCSYLPDWADMTADEKPRAEGTRLAVVQDVAGIAPDAQQAGKPFELPGAQTNADWPQHSGMFKAGESHLALAGELNNRDGNRIGEGTEFHHTLIPAPVVADGRVFAMDAEGVLSAHDMADIGKVLWVSPGVSQEDEDDTLGGGLAAEGGTVFAVSGRGLVAALDAATGQQKWRRSLGLPLRSAPKVGGGKLYVVSLDNQVFALNTADGEVQWAHRGIAEAAGIMNAVSPAFANGLVVAPYSSGQIYVLDSNSGKEIWSDSLSHSRHTKASSQLSGIGGDPVVDGDVVMAVSSGGMISVQALANGNRVWEKPIGSLNTPWVSGDWVFMISSDNAVVALHKFTGQVRWVTQLQRFEDEEDKKGHITWRGPVLASGQLLVVSSHGQLALLAAETGAITGTRDVPEDIYTAPVVAGGKVYLVDQDAELYSLQ